MARILITQGWVVTYILVIYHLNLLLAFLSSKIDPALAELEAEEEDGPRLPLCQNDPYLPRTRLKTLQSQDDE